MPRFLRIRSRLGALSEPQRVSVLNTFEGEFARKAGGSAICKKREKNSLAALPIVYLFFIIYQKSKVWTITRLENLSGAYVECYRFSIFVVIDSVYYKYQYSKTYTLRSDLNRLQVYVTGIKEKQIFKRIQVANMSTF